MPGNVRNRVSLPRTLEKVSAPQSRVGAAESDQRLGEAIALLQQADKATKVMIASQPTSKILPPEFEKLWNKPINL